jgi:DNA-directed RNA polymerase I subunit RPA43
MLLLFNGIESFCSRLDGILAGYGKLYLQSATGDLLNEETHVHLNVVSDFWVFRPVVGATLKGTVNETSPTHVSVIVHGCFNVPCYKPLDQDVSRNYTHAFSLRKLVIFCFF